MSLGLSSQCLYFLRLVADSTPCFLLFRPLPRSVLWPFGWIMGLRLFESMGLGGGGSARDIIRLVCSGQRCWRGLGVRESLVYRLCVFTFLMVSASFRDCWKWKEMLLFCLVMEKSNPIHQGIQMKKSQAIYLVGSGCCILGKKKDDFTDEFETSSMDRGMGKTIWPSAVFNHPCWSSDIYLLQTVIAYTTD